MDEGNVELPVSIPEFYKGKSVFITGFTGVLGKLLVEKLLYSCPEINKIYVLIREKKGVNVESRLKAVFESLAFNRVKEKYPGILEKKVIPIPGDVLNENLGLSNDDKELIRKEVSIIFHGAASVKFDDPINDALEINTLPAIKMMDLAMTMPNLKCYCHISTAYTNCDNIHIKEEIYPPKADWKDSLTIAKKIDPTTFRILSAKYNGQLPNTYVFAKSLAEQIINEYRDRLPVVIVRPAVVFPAYKEPMAGWVDNVLGPGAVMVGSLTGLLRCFFCDERTMCNYIPSDVVINSFIIIAWKTSLQYNPKHITDSVTIYNASSPMSFNRSHRYFDKFRRKGLCPAMLKRDKMDYIWYTPFKNNLKFRINVIFREVIPAAFIDSILRLMKQKPLLLKMRRKIFITLTSLKHFTFNTFTIDNDKFMGLMNDLNSKDQESFGWDYNKITIDEIHDISFCILSSTVLKPFYDDLETNRKRIKGLYYIDKTSYTLGWIVLIWLIISNNIPLTLFNIFYSLIFF